MTPTFDICLRVLRRVGLLSAYARAMGIARRNPEGRRDPVPAPEEFSRYEGLWVAVLDGQVIAAASTSRELVYALAKIGPRGKGATMQRVPSRDRGILVGMG